MLQRWVPRCQKTTRLLSALGVQGAFGRGSNKVNIDYQPDEPVNILSCCIFFLVYFEKKRQIEKVFTK
jgi:hypothetical protein